MEVLENLNTLLKTFAFWYFWLTTLYVMCYILFSYAKFRYELKKWNKEYFLNPDPEKKKPEHSLNFLFTMKSILWLSLWLACRAIL